MWIHLFGKGGRFKGFFYPIVSGISLFDILQKQYFLMNHFNQPYDSIEKMPLFEADVFIEMKVDELKEKLDNLNKNGDPR